MEHFPWWTEEQKRLADELGEFAEEVMPRDAEARWKREFPWDIFEKIAKKGYTGVPVPKEYGGMGLRGDRGLRIPTRAARCGRRFSTRAPEGR